MKKRNLMTKRRSLCNTSRRRQLLKQIHRKLQMRRQIFQHQIEGAEWAEAS
ncbi:hypothetical protein KIH87_03570 [Paraneptunicella aestuarii]|uniref:hypothetical protein n=1 Tax=Paraneptunicella aestuarii TaxID=2831148 RepID=UPI001E509E0C|nr:hypothetical protein [Paraneptunicella aestuarii]UAA39448.1 hypothetical protein KIH87_03570 [Paraneptunicella aestuarii]